MKILKEHIIKQVEIMKLSTMNTPNINLDIRTPK